MHTPEKLTTENKPEKLTTENKADKIQEVKGILNQLNFSKYRDFNERYWDEEEKLKIFKEKIKNDISEILILDIKEKDLLTKEERKKLPEEILRFKNYFKGGIKYYILKSQDEILKAFVGVYWSTTGRANDYYMQQIIEDPEIKKKTRKIEVSMEELLNE